MVKRRIEFKPLETIAIGLILFWMLQLKNRITLLSLDMGIRDLPGMIPGLSITPESAFLISVVFGGFIILRINKVI